MDRNRDVRRDTKTSGKALRLSLVQRVATWALLLTLLGGASCALFGEDDGDEKRAGGKATLDARGVPIIQLTPGCIQGGSEKTTIIGQLDIPIAAAVDRVFFLMNPNPAAVRLKPQDETPDVVRVTVKAGRTFARFKIDIALQTTVREVDIEIVEQLAGAEDIPIGPDWHARIGPEELTLEVSQSPVDALKTQADAEGAVHYSMEVILPGTCNRPRAVALSAVSAGVLHGVQTAQGHRRRITFPSQVVIPPGGRQLTVSVVIGRWKKLSSKIGGDDNTNPKGLLLPAFVEIDGRFAALTGRVKVLGGSSP